MKRNILLFIVIVASAATTRLLPHAWNFAPVTAIAIVAALYLPLRSAILLPLAIRLVSDAVIGFFSWPLMLGVYLAHLFGVILGLWVRQHKSFPRVVTAPVLAAIAFFLITNFAFLYSTREYSHDLAGIILAYSNGLPFLRGTLLGDLGYTLALVGGVEAVRAWQRRRRAQPRSLAASHFDTRL